MKALTPREKTVVVEVGRGHSNKTIGIVLNLSEDTVKTYIFHVCQKLNVANKRELAIWACRSGFAEVTAGQTTYEKIRAFCVGGEFTLDQARELLVIILDRAQGNQTVRDYRNNPDSCAPPVIPIDSLRAA